MLLSNWIAGFFDRQDLQTKLIDLLDILHRNIHQRNYKSETNTLCVMLTAFLSNFTTKFLETS